MRKIAFVLFLFYSIPGVGQTKFKSLNYLYSISGSKTVSGQHNDQKDGTSESYYTNRVNTITGKYPGLYSADFLFHGNSDLRWALTYEAERQWNAGSIINIMWHTCTPIQGNTCGWGGGVISSLTDAQWNELITDGSNLNKVWKARIDEISVYLQYLRDKGVEVLWRPLHEMNQGAFWWGGRTGANGTRKLYQLTHDYMTNVKGLSNLIWVWDVQDLSTNYGDYNPGNSYWDVAALDIYGNGFNTNTYYNALLAQAGSKPIAIGESFTLPSTSFLNSQPRWAFFMTWAYGLERDDNGNPTNSISYIKEVYSNTRIVTRDEMPGWSNPVPPNLATNKPVTVSSNEVGTTNVAALAVDGNYSTRWSSDYADPQWIYVDLGSSFQINEVKISWETACARDYQLQISSDASNWTTIKTIAGNTSLSNDHTLLNTSGRYVRIYGTARATSYGYSIYELEVYGTNQTPFGGTARVLPGIIQAEDYDNGGEGVAYHDVDAANVKGVYRTDGADVEACAEGGYNLADVKAGEWTEYTVNITTPGIYNLQARVAAPVGGQTLIVQLEGVTIGTQTVPTTGGWQTWQTVSITTPSLSTGIKVLRLTFNDSDVNVNYLNFSSANSTINLAANKPTTTSSTEGAGLEGANAVDTSADTRWASIEGVDPQWIYVDLGATYAINRVKISWEAAYATSYQVQVSGDASTWTTIKSSTGNTSLVNDWTGLSSSGRYIRIYGTARGTDYGYSLYELEVYGTPANNLRQQTTNTESFSKNITVYPNPVTNKVTVVLPEYWHHASQIVLLSTAGTVIKKEAVNDSEHTFDLSNLGAGIYLIKVFNGKDMVTHKILKSKE